MPFLRGLYSQIKKTNIVDCSQTPSAPVSDASKDSSTSSRTATRMVA
jgi:hypothetical protein